MDEGARDETPLSLGLLEVLPCGRPIAVIAFQDSAEIAERGDSVKVLATSLNCEFGGAGSGLVLEVLAQAGLSSLARGTVDVVVVKGDIVHMHVAFGAAWKGGVALFKDAESVLMVTSLEVEAKPTLRGGSAWASRDRALPLVESCREATAIGSWCGRCCGD